MAKTEGIPIDDLVKALQKNGNENAKDVQSLYGFVGPSESEEHITLYLDIHLSTSLHIRKADILHSVKLSKSQNPVGGTMLWVKNRVAYLYYGSVERKEAAEESAKQNAYLQGNIYEQYMSRYYGKQTSKHYSCNCPSKIPEKEADKADHAASEE